MVHQRRRAAAIPAAKSIGEFAALITDTTATDEAIWPTSTLAKAPLGEQWADPSKLARSARGAAGYGPMEKYAPTRLAKQVRTPPRAVCALFWRSLRVGDLRLHTPSPQQRGGPITGPSALAARELPSPARPAPLRPCAR